ncbi:hypothetical protein [Aquimarina sp. 2201CG14-23]|uniref:hypothetical protein n=1 Tax=Aquimarina mycalae TaxID=3040073 RepID=UPI002477EA86|nr:hypothetical protein [Aquimarina sp. 2201CG14-23]MDH7446914.1 hypothetical protein [Aquimarina sp. 2201CG14-23]
MLKNILKENGVQEIKKNQQKSINGGFGNYCPNEGDACIPGTAVSCITATPVCEDGSWTYGGLGGGNDHDIIHDLTLIVLP